MARIHPHLLSLFVSAALLTLVPRAHAYTQWSAALTLGGGGRLLPLERAEGLVSVGLRADVLFGPRDPFYARFGPYASAWTDDFDSLSASAGVSLLLPTSTTTPFVLSFGAMTTFTETPGLPIGMLGRVWWGSRSINYHSSYGMSVGLWVETRWLPDNGNVELIAGLDGDLAFLSIPGVLLWNWLTR